MVSKHIERVMKGSLQGRRTGASRRGRHASVMAVGAALLAGAPAVRAVDKALNTDAVGPTANFTDPIWSIGTVGATGGASPVVSTDALFFNTSGATTLTNDIAGATFNGFTFNSGASAYTFGGNAFTLNGNVTNNSSSLQTFGNNIVISDANGTSTFNAGAGGLTLTGNISATNATAGGNRGVSFAGAGVTTLSGTNDIAFRNAKGFSSTAAQLNITGSTTIRGTENGAAGAGLSGNTLTTVSSTGTFTFNGTIPTIAVPNPSRTALIVGQNLTGTSTLRVDGGAFNVGVEGGLTVGNNRTDATGVLTIDGGTASLPAGGVAGVTTDLRNFVSLGRDQANGVVNLNGGTLETGRFFARDTNSGAGQAIVGSPGNTAAFNFNGGTLRALASQADWFQSSTSGNNLALTSVTAGATSGNLSTIDANGFSVAINNAITGLGGFNIDSTTGTGVVTFGGTDAKTYAGATNVVDSTLSLASTSALAGASGTGGVNVSGGTLTSTVADADLGGSLAVSGSGALSANGNAAVGTFDLAADKNFTLSAGTLFENLASTSSFDTITGSGGGTFAITGGTLDLLGVVPDYTAGYAILSGFTGGSVSNLSIVNYDTTNYTASLNNTGVLTFVPVPEPTALALLAVAGSALIGRRTRRPRRTVH